MADVVVVGAGVIGLTSAICLAEDGLDVRIVAADPPQRTTSRVAGAMWGWSFARCAAIDPRPAGARVIEHRVGLCPARRQVRVEAERLGGSLCVHNYGHGGTGVGLAWGCARDVRALVGR